MTAPPDLITRTRQWLDKADHDLQAAETLLQASASAVPDVICYHCQQCAEKHLKAVLVFRAEPVPRTHDLVVLLARIQSGAAIGVDLPVVAALNRYATEARYPGDWEPITPAEAENAVAAALSIREAVRRALPAEATA